jgi:hypothetical protein
MKLLHEWSSPFIVYWRRRGNSTWRGTSLRIWSAVLNDPFNCRDCRGCHITTFDSVRLLKTSTLASGSRRWYRTYRNLLVSCFFVTSVNNIATLIPGYIVALLLFLDMMTFVSLFVALSLFLATNIFFQGGFVIKKGGTSGTWAKYHDNQPPKMQQHLLLNRKVISAFVATYFLAGRQQGKHCCTPPTTKRKH